MALISLNLTSAIEIQTPTPPSSMNLVVVSAIDITTPGAISALPMNLIVPSAINIQTSAPPSSMNLVVASAINITTPGVILISSSMNLMVASAIEVTTPGAISALPMNLVADTGLLIGAYKIAPYVFVWSVQPYHTKRYGVAIGDYDLSSQATAISATKSADELYLSVTIAGLDAIDGITANQLEQVRFYTYWHNQKTGEREQIGELLAANFEAIDPQIGGRSRSLTLQARAPGEVAVTPTTHSVEDAEYSGGNQLRLQNMAGIRVGDVVEHANGSMTVKTITHTFGAFVNAMTLTGV